MKYLKIYNLSLCFISFSNHAMDLTNRKAKIRARVQELKRQKSQRLIQRITQATQTNDKFDTMTIAQVKGLELSALQHVITYLKNKAHEKKLEKEKRNRKEKTVKSDRFGVPEKITYKYINGQIDKKTFNKQLVSKKAFNPFEKTELYEYGLFEQFFEYGETLFGDNENIAELERTKKVLQLFRKVDPQKAREFLDHYDDVTEEQKQLNESRQEYRTFIKNK